MKNVLLYLWQLPQNLIGLLLVAIYKPGYTHITNCGNRIYYSSRMQGGISLGKYSIVHTSLYQQDVNDALMSYVVQSVMRGRAVCLVGFICL